MRRIITSPQAGFTLVETLIVVLFLSMFALAAQPALNSSVDHARLSAASDEVALALKYAQASAASSGIEYRVTFDEAAETLLVERLESAADFTDGALTEIDRSVAESISYQVVWHPLKMGKAYEVDFSRDTGISGVDIFDAAFGSASAVSFDSLGIPSDGGSVRLRQGKREATVTMDAVSGRLSISGI
jgi:type II secretory pathway pseudopilin PulG